MTLHLISMGVDPRALAIFAAARRLSDDDGGYALHAALAARFGETAPRPFCFLPDHGRGPHLLGYTADRSALEEATALPAVDDLLTDLFAPPRIRAMPDTWRNGARYGFEVRVRPVVRFGKSVRADRAERPHAWQRKAGEIDAFGSETSNGVYGAPSRKATIPPRSIARRSIPNGSGRDWARRRRWRRPPFGSSAARAPVGAPMARAPAGPMRSRAPMR